jgi:hypothetical protein
MKVLRTATPAIAAFLLVSASLPALGEGLKDQLVGTWTYVAVDIVRPDGSRTPLYGPNPHGMATFDSKGRYILLVARDSMSKFASNDRAKGTPEENKAAVDGAIAHFGNYTVNDADKTITFHIETSTFPNWNGTDQKRPFAVSGDEFRWQTAGSSGGGIAEVVLKRAK